MMLTETCLCSWSSCCCCDGVIVFLELLCWWPWLWLSVGWNTRMQSTSSDSEYNPASILLLAQTTAPCSVFMLELTLRTLKLSDQKSEGVAFYTHFFISLSLSGNVAEPSTPSSCFTWKTTNLNSVFAPKMRTDSCAAYSRTAQPHSSWLRPHSAFWVYSISLVK